MRRGTFKRKSYQEVLEARIGKQKREKVSIIIFDSKSSLGAKKGLKRSPLRAKFGSRAKLKRGSMICAIPPKMRAEMAEDPFYKQSALSGKSNNIQWHHNLIYDKKRVNEKWAIIPLTKDEHREEAKYKDKLNWIMTNRATDEELKRYSKAVNYKQMRVLLNKKYGIYNKERKLLQEEN